MKAQESRLDLLTKRIAMIRAVLDENNLLQAVNDRLKEHFTSIDKSPSDVTEVDDETLRQYSSIEVLVPEVETLPASIHALFLHDLAKKQKRLRVKQIMLREKEDTRVVLQSKITELQKSFEDASDRLHEQKMKTDTIVDQRVEEAKRSLEGFKVEYDALLQQSRELNARLTKQRDVEHQEHEAKKTEREQANAKAKREAIRNRFAKSTSGK